MLLQSAIYIAQKIKSNKHIKFVLHYSFKTLQYTVNYQNFLYTRPGTNIIPTKNNCTKNGIYCKCMHEWSFFICTDLHFVSHNNNTIKCIDKQIFIFFYGIVVLHLEELFGNISDYKSFHQRFSNVFRRPVMAYKVSLVGHCTKLVNPRSLPSFHSSEY